jgi:hypothetical protein
MIIRVLSAHGRWLPNFRLPKNPAETNSNLQRRWTNKYNQWAACPAPCVCKFGWKFQHPGHKIFEKCQQLPSDLTSDHRNCYVCGRSQYMDTDSLDLVDVCEEDLTILDPVQPAWCAERRFDPIHDPMSNTNPITSIHPDSLKGVRLGENSTSSNRYLSWPHYMARKLIDIIDRAIWPLSQDIILWHVKINLISIDIFQLRCQNHTESIDRSTDTSACP